MDFDDRFEDERIAYIYGEDENTPENCDNDDYYDCKHCDYKGECDLCDELYDDAKYDYIEDCEKSLKDGSFRIHWCKGCEFINDCELDTTEYENIEN